MKNKIDVDRLRKEIQESLEQVNWQQIDKEVNESINKESIENMRASLKDEYENMNKYKILQQEYEKIKTQLQQQQEKYKKDAEIKLIDIRRQIEKNKRIEKKV